MIDELVVTCALDEQALALGQEGATRDDAIVSAGNREVRHVGARAAEPREERASGLDVASEVARKQPGARSSFERTRDADGSDDARIAPELGHEPARREPPDAVTDEMDPDLGRRKALDELSEPLGDAPDAEPGGVGERRRPGGRPALDGVTERPKHACRREKSVQEHDHVAAFRLRDDGSNIAVKEGRLARESESL
jgi:hypothetical protein